MQLEPTCFPAQASSPQPQSVRGSVAGLLSVEMREDDSEKIAAFAEQVLGAASVRGPTNSAARPGAASQAPISRKTRATGINFLSCTVFSFIS
jgi:hypothetical protein